MVALDRFPSPAAKPWSRRALIALAVLGVGAVAIARLRVLAQVAPTDFDDAYTYLRYAQHLLAGQGLAWNPGERPIFGVTSLLHLGLVTAIRAAFPRLALWRTLELASGAAGVGLLAALVASAALTSRHPRLARNWVAWSVLLVPALALREAFTFHAGTGMDTMLSALANATLVFVTLALARRPSRAGVALAVLAAVLAVLARPDNLACAVLGPALALALLAPAPRRRPLLIFSAGCTALLALVAALAWRWLGTPVPLSFFVKQPGYYGGFAGEFAWDPFRFLGVFLDSAWPFLVALVLFGRPASLRRWIVLVAPALLSIVGLFRFNQIMGHLGRFYYPFLPFFVAAAVCEFDDWLSRARAALRPKAILVRVTLALALVLAVRHGLTEGAQRYTARGEAQELPSVGGYHIPSGVALPEVDSWESARQLARLAAAAPAGASFAMSEHGLPGAAAPHIVIVDVLGLHDPSFAKRGFSARELFRRRPEVIWMPHADHAAMLREIYASDELWAHYDVYPEAFFHGLAVRRDGLHAAALQSLVAAAWAATYPGLALEDARAVRGE